MFVKAYARSTFDETNSRSFTDDEFRDMIQVRKKQLQLQNRNDRVWGLAIALLDLIFSGWQENRVSLRTLVRLGGDQR